MFGLLVFLILVSERAIRAIERPNVILMFIDDTGWGDYGFNDPKRTDSPNLDALARRGMIFSDFHAGASVCTPSRASLLTGRLGIRTGVISNFSPFSEHGLPKNETTIAEMLREEAGYATAATGKWHLGHVEDIHRFIVVSIRFLVFRCLMTTGVHIIPDTIFRARM